MCNRSVDRLMAMKCNVLGNDISTQTKMDVRSLVRGLVTQLAVEVYI